MEIKIEIRKRMETENKEVGTETHALQWRIVLVNTLYPKRYRIFKWRIFYGKISKKRFEKL